MKFKNIYLAAFIVSLLFASNAAASTEIDYDRDNQVLTVTTKDYFNHDSQVSLLMYKTSELGAGTISGLSLDEFRAISPYFYEKKADSNGVAEFNIPLTANMRENGGDYTVKLASKAMISMPYMNCELYSDTELTSAFNNLLSYIDNNNLSKHLEDESFRKVLGLDEIYNNVQDKSIVSVSLAKYKNLNGISSFSDIKKAESYIDDGEQLFKKMNNLSSWLNVRSLVDSYYSYKGSESDEYAYHYKLLTDTSAIDKKIYEKRPYAGLETFEDVFKDAVNNPTEEQPAYQSGGGGGSTGGGGAVIGAFGGTTNPISNPPIKTSAFSDISDDFWAKDSIEQLVLKGVVSGMGDNTFAPNDLVTREQFLKMLLLSGKIDCDAFDCNFTDVNKDEWYYNYVATAEIMGLTSGYGDGSFGIGRNITREDICVLAYRLISSKIYVKETNFEDVSFQDKQDISDYAKQAVDFLKEKGVISGYSDGTFMPKNTATRAEACKIILGIIDILAK